MTGPDLPALTRAQRAALGLAVAAGGAGAIVSNQTATEPVRVHWRTAAELAALGYVRDHRSVVAMRGKTPLRVVATEAGRQRMRIEYRAERQIRHPSNVVDLRIGKPQKRGALGR